MTHDHGTTLTVSGREPIPDAVAELIRDSPRGEHLEKVFRRLPAAEADGTPPSAGVSVAWLSTVTGEDPATVMRILDRLREAGVAEKGYTSVRGVMFAHYRTDTVNPALAGARERESTEPTPNSLPPPARRVRPGGPTMDDPFAVNPAGPFASRSSVESRGGD